eukprot:Nk52_evm1s846 gene=Nk52_evmTU1s846
MASKCCFVNCPEVGLVHDGKQNRQVRSTFTEINGDAIKTFAPPKDERQRKKWELASRRKKLPKYPRCCRLHYNLNDFEVFDEDNNIYKLKPGTLPTHRRQMLPKGYDSTTRTTKNSASAAKSESLAPLALKHAFNDEKQTWQVPFHGTISKIQEMLEKLKME